MSQVTPTEAHEKMKEGWHLLDVRPAEEFAQRHVPDSFNIPFNGKDFLDTVKDTFSIHDAVIITCADGTYSTHALIKMAANKFRYLHELTGGMKAWVQQGGLPIE